ncbi:hypothetical protein HELRODRAFT_121655, partial [Helobdella robusta]|uniref:Membrane insertase YidC/Oxa/ALB C-terminal domain-containing protein n=1 Tax=Helobdella robusta TaxID=6412 RepID=T1EGS6_HELRO
DPNITSLGLGGWSPKGLVENGLEFLHCTLDIPWWSAIVIGTVCLRLAIFPLVILAQRNAANLNNNMPTVQRLQQRMTQARMSGNVQQAMESSKQLMEFMKVNNVNPLKNLLVPLAQIPIFLSVFTAIREMTNLPVASWKSGGILWFTDLTVPDPFYILPVVTAATLFATIELGVDGIKADQVGSSTIKFVLRSMPFITFPIMIQFPSAMLCYWFTSNTFSLLQVLILKIPKVKSLCKIPPLIDHTTAYPLKEINVPKQTFAEGFKQSMKNMEITYKLAEQQKLNEIKM